MIRWGNIYFVLVLMLLVCIGMTAQREVGSLDLHHRAIVCDLHCDTVMRLLQGVPLGMRGHSGHIDIPRLKEGGVDLQVFACWVDPVDVLPEHYIYSTKQLIGKLLCELQANQSAIALATTGSQAENIIAQDKIAAVLAIEGGHSIQNSIDTLKAFHQQGVRCLTLTWNNSLDWADAAADTLPQHDGLTNFGREIVVAMNTIGMMIDVSHASESTFWDVIETTSDPIIASHSCAHALCPHYRNLKDDQIRAIARNGGMIGIHFYSGFLDSTFEREYTILKSKYRAHIDSLWEAYKENIDRYHQERNALLGDELRTIQLSVERVIDHIDYIVKLVGPEYVGLGSDFDGTSQVPRELADCSRMPFITTKLIERGYSERNIQKILGGNFMRIFKEVCG